ncbi:RNA polymerase II Elongator subunit [Myxozyma melibiosi]|uniref:Elongator complex protein 1 n=1 Tax=Myxozyma melibiosi TaxID=54550 RepID=A0ABR1F424_9ASCO
MWNLQQIQRARVPVSSAAVPDLPLTAAFIDAVSGDLICAFGPSTPVSDSSSGLEPDEDDGFSLPPTIELQRITKDGRVIPLASWEPAFSDDHVLDLRFFPDDFSAVVVCAKGDIVLVSSPSRANAGAAAETDSNLDVSVIDDEFLELAVSIVGSIDAGIAAACWSPDEEVLALVTADNNLVLLNRHLDAIAEKSLTSSDLKSSQHVSVGWGKKETQFEGKGVKGMRDPTVPEKVDDGAPGALDDSKTRISWRGDGQYLAINSVDTFTDDQDSALQRCRRTIRVYSREGNLDSVSEPVDGQESFLSWRPSGNLIASVKREIDGDERRLEVIFFERNGLRRGEFTTRLFSDQKVLDLQWNSQSSALALLLNDRLQIWTMNNYHWYLKQEVHMLKNESVSFMKWHTERPLTLILASNNVLEIHEFSWDLFEGTKNPPYDIGMTLVADGTSLKITPLGIANTPPPMSFRDIDLAAPVVYASSNSNNELIAILEHGALELAKWKVVDERLKSGTPVVCKTTPLAEFVGGSQAAARIVKFVGRDVAALLVDFEKSCRLVLLRFKYDHESEVSYSVLYSEDFKIPVTTLTPRVDDKAVCIELATGEVRQVLISSAGEPILPSAKIAELPERCVTISAAVLRQEAFDDIENVAAEEKIVVFGLTASGRLYAGRQRLSASCTSFSVTETHLAFTTAQNLLKFVHLSTSSTATGSDPELDVPADVAVGSNTATTIADERCRAVERGAKIVTVIPSKVSVVLQMPRGNLETIFPRLLVLEGVRRQIEKLDYAGAFLSCRVHRVNLDILYDYDPELFINNVEGFVDALGKVEYLDLFLSGLTNEDVTKTIYKETLPSAQKSLPDQMSGLSLDPTPKPPVETSSKVNRICDAVLQVLQAKYSQTHVQSIITAHVCKDPPDIDAALNLISGFARDDNAKLTSAVEHLCFLQDVNKLYDHALGLYDLRLALIIARQSQKDPREYLPFMENLQKQVPLRRRFLLDTHLGRNAKALVHLADLKFDEDGADIFNEVEQFVVKHNLYKDAMNIYKYEPVKLYAILKLYAKHLRANNEFKESGLAFESLGDYEDALESYVLGLDWREALAVCELGKHQISFDKRQSTALQLAEALHEARRYQEAATVYVEYRRDLKEAIASLCKGFLFAEAIRLILLQNEFKYLEDIIDPALVDGFNQISEFLSDCRSQIAAQLARLRELRAKKALDPLAYYDGIGDGDADVPDNVSIAATSQASTSGQSLFTRYTGKTGGTAQTGASRRTAKNRRREERKRARGKKGSIYEEEYLVNSIRRMIERVNETRSDARNLIESLSRRAMRERGVEIQRRYVELVEDLRGCVVEVCTVSEADRTRYDDDGNRYLIPEVPVPVVEVFEKMHILDYN